jgi:hypothetical protein
MDETNKTLALLLVAAIVVSLGGTIVSLNKIGQFEGLVDITGRQVTDTSTGTVQLNLTSDTAITVTRNTIDFGNGYVNSSCDNCTMWTNSTSGGTSYSLGGCCVNEWKTVATSGEAMSGLWIQNTGNENLSVNLNFSANATSFIGGDTVNGTCTGVAEDDTTDSCGGSLLYTTTWYDFNTSDPYVCGGAASYPFEADGTQDEFVLDAKVIVPRNAPAEEKSVTLTFTGTSS